MRAAVLSCYRGLAQLEVESLCEVLVDPEASWPEAAGVEAQPLRSFNSYAAEGMGDVYTVEDVAAQMPDKPFFLTATILSVEEFDFLA